MAAGAWAANPHPHLEDPALVLGVYVVPVTAHVLVSNGWRAVALFHKGKPAGEESREGEEEACPFTGAGGSSVASVIRFNSGGFTTVEKIWD